MAGLRVVLLEKPGHARDWGLGRDLSRQGPGLKVED